MEDGCCGRKEKGMDGRRRGERMMEFCSGGVVLSGVVLSGRVVEAVGLGTRRCREKNKTG